MPFSSRGLFKGAEEEDDEDLEEPDDDGNFGASVKYMFTLPHVEHVHKPRFSAQAPGKKNFATFAGFAIRCHVISS